MTPPFNLKMLLSAFREVNCQEKRNGKYLTWKIQREKNHLHKTLKIEHRTN